MYAVYLHHKGVGPILVRAITQIPINIQVTPLAVLAVEEILSVDKGRFP